MRRRPLILHADNGAAPTAYTLKAKLEALGIRPSHSRPGVSDDNAHMEAWFRTAKYRPSYPTKGFADIQSARAWALKLVSWYNGEHRHSAIGFVTPAQRHVGDAPARLAARKCVYEVARARNPRRWSRATRRWQDPEHVWLNPPPKAANTGRGCSMSAKAENRIQFESAAPTPIAMPTGRIQHSRKLWRSWATSTSR